MKKTLGLLLVICFMEIQSVKAQYVQLPTIDLYDTELMNAHLNAVREMSQRAARIRETVQPYRERQYQYYKEGKYREAVEICYDVHRQYVYYVYDNRAISDMEILAGDCALKIGAYESAIDWYQTAQRAEVSGMDYRLSQVFNTVMEDARYSFRKGDYSNLWSYTTIALKTGWESGECYYYQGICYECAGNISDDEKYKLAKKMYKLAKKKKYTPAISALKNLKKKK